MPQKESAGLVLFRRTRGLEVLLGHPGGPYWTTRDSGAWSIPKGGIQAGETPLEAAQREFLEETGMASRGPYVSLGTIVQRSGKLVYAWAFEGDCDPARLVSILTTTEWPPRSGRLIEVPEIDAHRFFEVEGARRAINIAQVELIDRLLAVVGH